MNKNGLPSNFSNAKNNANIGLTREEVILKENSELNSIKSNVPINFYNYPNIKPFYDKDAIAFLQNYNKYCKENGDSFNVKWSEWKKTIVSRSKNNSNSNYMKNPKIPTYLYVISQDIMTPSERTMIATLQGIVNNHCFEQIYTLNSLQPDYQIWLDDLMV